MAELLEHPLVSRVPEYMDSPNRDAQCAELIELLSSISVAADELERAIVDVPPPGSTATACGTTSGVS